jgi:hypothetical protein
VSVGEAASGGTTPGSAPGSAGATRAEAGKSGAEAAGGAAAEGTGAGWACALSVTNVRAVPTTQATSHWVGGAERERWKTWATVL